MTREEFEKTNWKMSYEEYQLCNCCKCNNDECIHRNAFRRVPEIDGGLGLCPNLVELGGNKYHELFRDYKKAEEIVDKETEELAKQILKDYVFTEYNLDYIIEKYVIESENKKLIAESLLTKAIQKACISLTKEAELQECCKILKRTFSWGCNDDAKALFANAVYGIITGNLVFVDAKKEFLEYMAER